MPEAQLIKFSYRELAELMVRKQGIKEGLWGIYVRFGIGGMNIGDSPESLVPAAVVALTEMGLQRFAEPSALTIDAATIWEK